MMAWGSKARVVRRLCCMRLQGKGEKGGGEGRKMRAQGWVLDRGQDGGQGGGEKVVAEEVQAGRRCGRKRVWGGGAGRISNERDRGYGQRGPNAHWL